MTHYQKKPSNFKSSSATSSTSSAIPSTTQLSSISRGKAGLQSLITNYQLPIVLILLLAAFFRFYQLFDLPPGLNFDEAGNGVAALDILSGAPKIWWRIGGGKEPVWPYLIALSTTMLGEIPFSLRFPAAGVGILTVAAVYPLIRVLFRNQPGHIIAVLTMLGLSLSAWHLHFSRLGFRAILLPLFSTLAFYFMWRGFTQSRLTFYVSRFTLRIPAMSISAFFIALAVYSYLGARLLPFVIIVYFTLDWLKNRSYSRKIAKTNKLQSPITNSCPEPSRRDQLPITLFVSLLLFLSPLILYFILNPADFLARSTTLSIFNPTWNKGDLIGTVWHTLTLTLSTYLGLHGDPNPLVNLPNQPALPLMLVPFFLIGLATSIFHAIRPHPLTPSPLHPRSLALNPHLLLLCWWAIMLLPAILAPEGAPHHLRLIGTIIPTYAFVALGFVTTTSIITFYASRFTHPARRFAYMLPVICYLLLGLQTYTNYFTRWPNSVDFTLPFDLYATRLTAEIARTPSNAAYVIPMDIRAAEEARHYTLDYLLASHQSPNLQSPFTYIPVDERNAETLLTRAAAGKDELRVVRWTEDKHREADAKEMVTFLLESNAQLTSRESFPVYDVETYALSGDTDFTLPTIDQPVEANLDNLLRLDVAFVQPIASPGGWLPVALTLAPLAPMNVDYKASLRLLNSSGERLAQKDRVLMHNFHQGTSLWPVETVNEYYLLPIPPDTPSGQYSVVVVVYHPDTLAPLVANGIVEVPLGVVNIQ